MLNLIRDNIQSFGVKFIVGVVVVVMLFFGVTAFRNQSINSIATVDGYEIKVQKYQRALDQAQNQIRARYKGQAADYMKMINLPAQIIQQLVNNALLLINAHENGLSVTDLELAQSIYHNEAFLTDNRFDPKKYDRMLANSRIDKITYEKDLRENLLTNKYVRFLQSGILINQQSLDRELKRFYTEMNTKVIEITPSLFTAQVKLTDDEIASYYNAHKDQFQQKKQFVIKYFKLNTDDIKDKVIVRDREISRYYQKNKNSEFTTKESFLARHILIPIPADKSEAGMQQAKKKAEAIYAKLMKNKDKFAEYAKTYSSDPGSAAKGGSLGWVEKGTLVKEFEDVLERLGIKEISKPFLTQFGYHIVQLENKKPAETKSLDEVKDQIKDKIAELKAARRLENQVSKLVKSMKDKPIEEIAKENGKKIVTSESFDDNDDIPEVGYSSSLYQAIKSKKLNDKSYYKLAGDNGVLVYQIVKIIEPFIKPLEDVRENVQYFATIQKSEELAKKALADYSTSIKTADQFNKIAKQFNIKPQSVKFKYLDSSAGNFTISNKFRSDVYKMDVGQIATIPEEKKGYIVQLIDKQSNSDIKRDSPEYKSIETALINQKANILLSEFVNQTRSEVDVKFNPKMLKALNIQFN